MRIFFILSLNYDVILTILKVYKVLYLYSSF